MNPPGTCLGREHPVNIINPRRACAARVTVVGSVCLSVTLHLTSRMFFRLTKDTTYLTGNEGQNFVRFSLKLLRCKARARKSQYANTSANTQRFIRVLCVPRRHQKMQRRACIASRMLSSSVVSPRQTLRELARDHE